MKGYVVFVPLRGFTLTLIIVLGSVGISILYELLQLPFLYELFYLLLQVSAVLCVMPVVLVETVIFLLSCTLGDECNSLGHLRKCSSLIYAEIWSIGIIKGVIFIV